MARILLVALVFVTLAAPLAAQHPPAAPPRLDPAGLAEEATEWLAGLLRIDTSNPPGNELAAARYLAGILEREGIEHEVIESHPGRGFVVARLRAGAFPDPARALLLVGHLDVVGVEREKWTVDPFGGELRDGYLWGRGALDDKGMVVANLAVLVALKRSGTPLGRDVIYLAVGDEEAGGRNGIEYVITRHWDKIAAGFAINEGGRVVRRDGRVLYVGVQTSEKIPVNVEVIARGRSGHGSVPHRDNPIVHLAAAIAKLGAWEAPPQLLSVTRRYFEGLERVEEPDTARSMRALLQPGRFELAARRLSEANPVWGAMLRTTVAPTILRAGFRNNVIPSEARATLNIRLLPGESLPSVLDQLRQLVDDPAIEFQAGQPTRPPGPPSSLDSELYRTIERVGSAFFDGAAVLPMLSTGATDSAQLRARSVQAYGLLPFPLSEEDVRRMHADDERIPLDSFRTGIEFLYRLVQEFVRSGP
jgi:acetylornithine deacetylase/succinyl-diaminopimelate desuccinylase-like protein